MSRMKTGALRLARSGLANIVMALSGFSLLDRGLIDEATFRRMPKAAPGAGNRRWARSRYKPHQGPRECARRLGMSVQEWHELHGRNRFMGGARG